MGGSSVGRGEKESRVGAAATCAPGIQGPVVVPVRHHGRRMRRMDEQTYRQGIRRRDPEAWSRLVKEHHAPLRRQARRILTSGMDPDNAVGEMWYRALASARRYDPRRAPFPWLARICLRTCLNQRERALRIVHDDVEPYCGGERQTQEEARRALRAALENLPVRQREVVALRYLFEVSVPEVAVLIRRSRKTVERRLLLALRKLRETADEAGLRALGEGA